MPPKSIFLTFLCPLLVTMFTVNLLTNKNIYYNGLVSILTTPDLIQDASNLPTFSLVHRKSGCVCFGHYPLWEKVPTSYTVIGDQARRPFLTTEPQPPLTLLDTVLPFFLNVPVQKQDLPTVVLDHFLTPNDFNDGFATSHTRHLLAKFPVKFSEEGWKAWDMLEAYQLDKLDFARHCPATRTLIFNALVQRGIDFPDLDYGKHPSFMFYNVINPTWVALLKLPVTAQIIPTLSLFATSRPHVQAALKEVLSLINVKTSSLSDFIFIELAFSIPLSTFNLPTEVEKGFT